VIVNGPNGGKVAQGNVLLLTRGRATVMIVGYRAGTQPFPAKLLSRLAAAAAKRLSTASPQPP
jgi:hypothetical protein